MFRAPKGQLADHQPQHRPVLGIYLPLPALLIRPSPPPLALSSHHLLAMSSGAVGFMALDIALLLPRVIPIHQASKTWTVP